MGLVYALLTAIFSTAKDVVSKSLASQVDSSTSTFASFAFALPFYLLLIMVLWLLGIEPLTWSSGFLMWVVLRAFSDMGAESCKMAALRVGDLSVVSAIMALYPAILLVVSPLLTGDVPSVRGSIGVLLSVLGTSIILYRPKTSNEKVDRRAIWLSIAATIFFCLNTSFDRIAVKLASPVLSGFSMTFLAGVFLLPVMFRAPRRWQQIKAEHKSFWLRGVFELFQLVSKLYALQFLQAPYVVSIMRLSLLFSILTGRLILKEAHFWQRLSGGVLVVIGVAVVVLEVVQ